MADLISSNKNRQTRPLRLSQVAALDAFPRGPLLALRRYRYFLKEQYDLTAGLEAFSPLRVSLTDLDKMLSHIESEFRRFVEGEIDLNSLDEFIREDAIPGLEEVSGSLGNSPDAGADGIYFYAVCDLGERLWENAKAGLPQLHDCLLSTSEGKSLLRPHWLLKFEDELRRASEGE